MAQKIIAADGSVYVKKKPFYLVGGLSLSLFLFFLVVALR